MTTSSTTGHFLWRLLWILATLTFIGGSAQAQFYFGKNKVQYTQFDWQVMVTDHFRIYFYAEEHEVAKIGARLAEDSYEALSRKFNYELRDKTPLIIYSSPNYFWQTNIVPGLLPEGVAGFTEFMKGRVALPFHGSYRDFAHVIQHELVHVFSITRLSESMKGRKRHRTAYPPQWFTEGLAEFWSKDWDTQADMVVKDLTINGRLLSIDNLWRANRTFFVYKLGESLCGFIDSAYGSDKLVRIFDNWHKGRTFEDVIKLTLGDDLATLSRKWHYALKKRYYPEIADKGLPRMESERLVGKGFAVKGTPIRWDDGKGEQDWIVYQANRMGYTALYIQPMNGAGKGARRLVRAENSSEFESLHILRSGIDANDSGMIAFTSKSKEKDVLYLYDLNESKVTRRYEFDSLIAARSPRFSPDGEKAVFWGVAIDGFSDLYLLDLASGAYKRLTDDAYYDIDPVFTADGSGVVFASDRCADGPGGAINLYRFDLGSTRIERLTYGPYRDLTPEATDNGLYFSSDREGGYNLYKLDESGVVTRYSNFVTGAHDPRLAPDGESLVYSGYQEMTFKVYQMVFPEEPKPVTMPLVSAVPSWRAKKIASAVSDASIKYDADYSFDIAQSALGYDPVYGSMGGFQAAVSDVLGNRAVYLLLSNTAESSDELLSSFNVGLTYVNRESRLNWGVGAFHFYDEYYNDFDQFYFERQVGALTVISYPISKFHRIDFTTSVRYSRRTLRFGRPTRDALLATNYASWIYDNSLWEPTGPIEGRRYNITLGLTTEIEQARNFNRLAMVDLRHYWRLGRYSALAHRAMAFSSAGQEPQRIYFGGSWSFRGFARREFYNRNVLFSSTELRFPLIDNLLIGFPIGGLGFRGIRGALFFDVGSAWDDEFDQFLGSFGAGIRVGLGYITVLRFDFSRTTDFRTISHRTDFDFFFGWNF